MSIDMYLEKSRAQANSVAARSRNKQSALRQLEHAANGFIVNSPTLDSEAYRNAKDYFAQVLLPLVRGATMLDEAIVQGCNRLPNDYTAQVETYDLKSSELQRKIAEAQARVANLESVRQNILTLDSGMSARKERLLYNNERSMMRAFDTQMKLQEQLNKLEAFNASSSLIFFDVPILQMLVTRGVNTAKGCWSGGRFNIPKKDMGWAKEINKKWETKLTKAKNDKIKTLKGYDVYLYSYTDPYGKKIEKWIIAKVSGEPVFDEDLLKFLDEHGHTLDRDIYREVNSDEISEIDMATRRKFPGKSLLTDKEFDGGLEKFMLGINANLESAQYYVDKSGILHTLLAAKALSGGKSGAKASKKGTIVSKYDDIHKYQYNGYENPGPLNMLDDQPNQNFYGGRYDVEVLKQPKTYYRAGNSERAIGQWFTDAPPNSVAEARINSAIKPQWLKDNGSWGGASHLDTVYKIEIPAGTTVYTGPVGNQGGIYQGGLDTSQIFIKQPWKIDGVTVLESKPLK